MRAVTASGCSINFNPNGIVAIVRYEGANNGALPMSHPYNITDMTCKDEVGLVPIVPVNLTALSYGEEFDLELVNEPFVKFTLNGSSLQIDWSSPTLLLVENLDPSFPDDYNVISLNGTSDTVPAVAPPANEQWTFFVIQSVGPLGLNHPVSTRTYGTNCKIHLHGHDFLLLAEGEGTYNDSVLSTINHINPTRRDVATMPTSPSNVTGGFIVLAFKLNNPGVWVTIFVIEV